MPNEKILTLLGFAAKSGNLSYGFAAAKSSIISGKAYAVVMSETVSEKSQKEITFFATKKSVPVLLLEGVDLKTLSNSVGRSCGILSVNSNQFAESVIKQHTIGGNAND